MFVWSRPARLESQRGGIILKNDFIIVLNVDIPSTSKLFLRRFFFFFFFFFLFFFFVFFFFFFFFLFYFKNFFFNLIISFFFCLFFIFHFILLICCRSSWPTLNPLIYFLRYGILIRLYGGVAIDEFFYLIFSTIQLFPKLLFFSLGKIN